MVDGEVEMAIFSYLGLMDLTTDLPVYTFHIKSNVGIMAGNQDTVNQ